MKRSFSAAMAAVFVIAGGLSPAMARDHHHHDNTGRVIAGGVAAGVIGGLVGGAIANSQPRYIDPTAAAPALLV